MNLRFDKRTMLLASVNARSEIHGDERQGAGDLGFSAKLPNDILSELHPSLKSALYYLDKAKPGDLVDQARVDEPGYLPHLRYPEIGSRFKWEVEMADVTVEITGKDGREVKLTGAKLNDINFAPLDGGTVDFKFRIQAHPDAKQFGKLCAGLIQTEVTVTVTPAPEPAELPGTTA
jgi:hypothetical protein